MSCWIRVLFALPPLADFHQRTFHLPRSCFWTLLLTAILFSGPIAALILYDIPAFGRGVNFSLAARRWIHYSLTSGLSTPAAFWSTVRNLLVAPVIEELIYRGCIFAVLRAGGFSSTSCLFWSPLLFGVGRWHLPLSLVSDVDTSPLILDSDVSHVAHLHHLINMLRNGGHSLESAMAISAGQLLITSIFGWYSGYLYLRTGRQPHRRLLPSPLSLHHPPARLPLGRLVSSLDTSFSALRSFCCPYRECSRAHRDALVL